VDLLGAKERLSIPLTWGGTRRAALEGAFELHNPVFQRLTFGVGVSRKENPFYKTGDFRKEAQGVLQRRLKRFELNLQSGWTNIEFGSQRADSANLGTSLAFDTRQDVNLPRNAVYAKIAWNRLSILGGGPGFNFYSLDLRGYKGIWGQAIVAGQFAYCRTDGRLPDWERPFLGGASTLRGYEPGAFSGDNIATTSLELRMTLSPLRAIYRSGIDVFLDSGAIYDYGQSLGSAKWKHGAGVGGYFLIAGFGIKVDVGYNMHDAFRVHFSTGFRF
jgi:hemolysin activation/secretion protein